MASGSALNLSNFTVQPGATLAVGANVAVTIGPPPSETTVTLADNGTLTFAAGDMVTFNDDYYYDGSQIVVGSGGLLNASTTTFNATNANGSLDSNFTQIVVNSGGELQASNTDFVIGQIDLNIGAVVKTGDLAGDAFDSPLYIPAIDVQYLSAPVGSNNLRFQGIYIQPDTLTTGESVALNAIGTQTASNLHYYFPGNFTINQGATLAVGANVAVTIGPPPSETTVTLADNGTLTFAAGDIGHIQRRLLLRRVADRRRLRRAAQRQHHHLQRHQRQRLPRQ